MTNVRKIKSMLSKHVLDPKGMLLIKGGRGGNGDGDGGGGTSTGGGVPPPG